MDRLEELATDLGFIGEIRSRIASLDQLQDDVALQEALAFIERVADQALGLEDGLRRGRVPSVGLEYPTAYRLARRLGALRGQALLELEGAQERLTAELRSVLERLGALEYLSPVVTQTLEAMGESQPVDEAEVFGLWCWIEVWLEVGIGGWAERLFRAERDANILLRAPFQGLALRRALGGLQSFTVQMGAGDLRSVLDDLAQRVERSDSSDPDSWPDPPAAFSRRFRGWLDRTLPTEGIDRVTEARQWSWAARFTGGTAGVDAAQVGRFLDQFGRYRWVGECLLDAVEWVDRPSLSRSVAFLMDAYGLTRRDDVAVSVMSGARHSSQVVNAVLDAGVGLPFRALEPAVRDPDLKTLVMVEDACITATRSIGELERTLDRAGDELAGKELIWVFGVGAIAGLERLDSALKEVDLEAQILVGREIRLLSSVGFAEWDEGTLLDEGGGLSNPSVQLANPLFGPHNPAWRNHDWKTARDVCSDIGYALLEQMAAEHNWSDLRRKGSALGFSGLQGRLVFEHRVPKTTLTLLWCRGTWNGRPWEPLFTPSEDAP